MRFGNKDRFAIEFELAIPSGGVWMFGHICYWICGVRVGDYEFATSLRDVLFSLETVTGDAGRRTNPTLFAMARADLGDLLPRGLFFGIEAENEPIQELAIKEQWARHVIKPECDVFDDWQAFLIESASRARCIYRHHTNSSFKECSLEYGEFDDALAEALQTLRQWYEQAREA